MEILHAVATDEERRFLSFHEWGILVYEPSTCHALHEIHSTDIIPGTQVRNQYMSLLLSLDIFIILILDTFLGIRLRA